MNTFKIIASVLLVNTVTNGKPVSFWVIGIMFIVGFVWELVKVGGWADAFKRESAAMYIKAVSKREIIKAKRDTLKSVKNGKVN